MSKLRFWPAVLILLNTASCFITVGGVNLIMRNSAHGYEVLYTGLMGLALTFIIAIRWGK